MKVKELKTMFQIWVDEENSSVADCTEKLLV